MWSKKPTPVATSRLAGAVEVEDRSISVSAVLRRIVCGAGHQSIALRVRASSRVDLRVACRRRCAGSSYGADPARADRRRSRRSSCSGPESCRRFSSS